MEILNGNFLAAMKKISIVTLSYNQARFLEQAICSVLMQDYPNLEYIVVDPGSTDGSRQLIEQYRGRISKVIFEPDAGQADGLNKGFSYATGEILGFLNADDMLMPGALSKIVRVFEKNPSADVVSGHGFFADESGKTLRAVFSNRFWLRGYAYGISVLVQQATFFRKVAFERTAGFNLHNRICWDGELWVDLALAGAKFARCHQYLAIFRIHQQGITGSGIYNDELAQAHQRICGKIGSLGKNKWVRLFLWFVDRITDPYVLLLRFVDSRKHGFISPIKR